MAGLPGAGKTVAVGLAAAAAARAGRTVHTLQWDVARLAFDTPAILARHPEVGGVTDPAIRLAVGLWARGAVLRWHRAHAGARDILVGETPLIGERLMELARPRDDALEPLLAGPSTAFVVPVPTSDVRAAIELARARDMAGARDTKSAPPDLVTAHWREIGRIAAELGVVAAGEPGAYDPELYAETYRRVLRHRHVVVARVADVMPADTGRGIGAAIVPTADEVEAAMGEVERLPRSETTRRASEWYRL